MSRHKRVIVGEGQVDGLGSHFEFLGPSLDYSNNFGPIYFLTDLDYCLHLLQRVDSLLG